MSVFTALLAEGRFPPACYVPNYLPARLQYEVLMGSHAYGTAEPGSDRDVFGWCITDEEARDWQWAEMQDRNYPAFKYVEAGQAKAPGAQLIGCDVVIDSLYSFLAGCVAGDSMILETLFAAEDNLLVCTPAARLLRDQRGMFLTKTAARAFIEFGQRQLEGMVARSYQPEIRQKYVDLYGYDVKAGYHCVRLLHQAEQMLDEGDLDLRRRADLLMRIRRGQFTESELVEHFRVVQSRVERKLASSPLPDDVDRHKLRDVIGWVLALAV